MRGASARDAPGSEAGSTVYRGDEVEDNERVRDIGREREAETDRGRVRDRQIDTGRDRDRGRDREPLWLSVSPAVYLPSSPSPSVCA